MPKIMSMPSTAYYRVIYTIRDYPRLKREYEILKKEIGMKATNYDGMPKGNNVASGIEDKAIRLADLEAEINRMQELINTIPTDMRDGILNNIYYGNRFPPNEWGQLVPSLRTWQREKGKFIAIVAHKLNIYKSKNI